MRIVRYTRFQNPDIPAFRVLAFVVRLLLVQTLKNKSCDYILALRANNLHNNAWN